MASEEYLEYNPNYVSYDPKKPNDEVFEQALADIDSAGARTFSPTTGESRVKGPGAGSDPLGGFSNGAPSGIGKVAPLGVRTTDPLGGNKPLGDPNQYRHISPSKDLEGVPMGRTPVMTGDDGMKRTQYGGYVMVSGKDGQLSHWEDAQGNKVEAPKSWQMMVDNEYEFGKRQKYLQKSAKARARMREGFNQVLPSLAADMINSIDYTDAGEVGMVNGQRMRMVTMDPSGRNEKGEIADPDNPIDAANAKYAEMGKKSRVRGMVAAVPVDENGERLRTKDGGFVPPRLYVKMDKGGANPALEEIDVGRAMNQYAKAQMTLGDMTEQEAREATVSRFGRNVLGWDVKPERVQAARTAAEEKARLEQIKANGQVLAAQATAGGNVTVAEGKLITEALDSVNKEIELLKKPYEDGMKEWSEADINRMTKLEEQADGLRKAVTALQGRGVIATPGTQAPAAPAQGQAPAADNMVRYSDGRVGVINNGRKYYLVTDNNGNPVLDPSGRQQYAPVKDQNVRVLNNPVEKPTVQNPATATATEQQAATAPVANENANSLANAMGGGNQTQSQNGSGAKAQNAQSSAVNPNANNGETVQNRGERNRKQEEQKLANAREISTGHNFSDVVPESQEAAHYDSIVPEVMDRFREAFPQATYDDVVNGRYDANLMQAAETLGESSTANVIEQIKSMRKTRLEGDGPRKLMSRSTSAAANRDRQNAIDEVDKIKDLAVREGWDQQRLRNALVRNAVLHGQPVTDPALGLGLEIPNADIEAERKRREEAKNEVVSTAKNLASTFASVFTNRGN